MFCFLGVDVHDPLASIMWVLRHGGDEISYRSFNRVCKSFSHDSLDESELSCDILERFTRHRGIGMDPTPRAPFTREGGRFSRPDELMASGAMAALLGLGGEAVRSGVARQRRLTGRRGVPRRGRHARTLRQQPKT